MKPVIDVGDHVRDHSMEIDIPTKKVSKKIKVLVQKNLIVLVHVAAQVRFSVSRYIFLRFIYYHLIYLPLRTRRIVAKKMHGKKIHFHLRSNLGIF